MHTCYDHCQLLLVPTRWGWIYAIDRNDGDDVWTCQYPQQSDYMNASISDGLLYVVDWNGAIEARDLANGDLVWRSKADGIISNAPSVFHDALYIMCSRGEGVNERAFIASYLVADGGLNWERELPGETAASGAPVVIGEVVVSTGHQSIHGQDRNNGRALWFIEYPHFGSEELIVDNTGQVLMGGSNGCWLIDGSTGKMVQHIDLLDFYTQEQMQALQHSVTTHSGQGIRLEFGTLGAPLPVDGHLYFTIASGCFGAIDAPAVRAPAAQGNTLPLSNN